MFCWLLFINYCDDFHFLSSVQIVCDWYVFNPFVMFVGEHLIGTHESTMSAMVTVPKDI